MIATVGYGFDRERVKGPLVAMQVCHEEKTLKITMNDRTSITLIDGDKVRYITADPAVIDALESYLKQGGSLELCQTPPRQGMTCDSGWKRRTD